MPAKGQSGHPRRRGWLRRSRRLLLTLGLLALVLLAARLALPYAIKAYVNRQLDRNPEYAGQVGDIDVQLWRGAYRIHSIAIFKTTGNIPVPFFAAKQCDLSIEWRELFHGSLVAEIELIKPELNFVAGETPEETQTGEDKAWDEMVKSLFPFKINRFEIRDGRVHFRRFHSNPPVDVFLDELYATVTNLTNSRDLSTELPAGILATGTTVGGGEVEVEVHLDPFAEAPTFEVTGQITNVDLVALNDFLKAYGKFDVERGTFSFYTAAAAKEGQYEGYVKVFFEDLDVFAWEKERKKNILQIFWQAIVGTVATVVKNQPKDRLATKIPISGSFEKSNLGTWTAISTLLRNAFIRALIPKLDEAVSVQEVNPKKDKGKDKPDAQRPKEDPKPR